MRSTVQSGPDAPIRTGVAQLVERRSPKPQVEGSSPSAGAKPYGDRVFESRTARQSSRGHNSVGRAPAWHAGGQRLPHLRCVTPSGRFDPAWLHQVHAPVAQLELERRSTKPEVGGSNPSRRTKSIWHFGDDDQLQGRLAERFKAPGWKPGARQREPRVRIPRRPPFLGS